MNIRQALLDDIPEIITIGRLLHDESQAWSRLRYSETRVDLSMRALISSVDGLVLLAENDCEIVGGIACLVTPHWSSDDYVAQEQTFFMKKEYRGNGAAVRLVTKMVQWAYTKGAVLLQAGTSTGIDPERCAEFYEKLGFHRSAIGLEVFFGDR